jgi:GMP synthase-like glutamine amidotransferase
MIRIRSVGAVELDEGQSIPDATNYDLMIVMGGPQDVWQQDEFPWLRDEKSAIRESSRACRFEELGRGAGSRKTSSRQIEGSD